MNNLNPWVVWGCLTYNAFLLAGAIHLYSKEWSGWWVVLALLLMVSPTHQQVKDDGQERIS